ncbi:hypothetical protein [Moorena bouillonii]|uniref:hypothetical protein n=1 Tax=Moorena bouillonii TaxID=207920 RepID=UPI00130147FD|nr:hypothetical protein [Moorena bouillonii]
MQGHKKTIALSQSQVVGLNGVSDGNGISMIKQLLKTIALSQFKGVIGVMG